jgi:hypothetical protein
MKTFKNWFEDNYNEEMPEGCSLMGGFSSMTFL